MIYIKDCPLSQHSTIRLGGLCEGYFPETEPEFVEIVRSFEEQCISYCVVGAMSNILPTDGRPKSKIVFCERLKGFSYQNSTLTLSSGIRLSKVIFRLAKENKVLFPSLIGVPGLVGGMVVQNASCYDDEVASQFLCAEVYSPKEDKVFYLTKEDMQFSYRSSVLKSEPYILLNASFSIRDGAALSKIYEVSQKRKMHMPEGPSLGSVFLRHNNQSIGYLLDILGQKGRVFGKIAVSQRHAGILINKSGGSAADYKRAVFSLSKLIEDNCGFTPRCEIEFLN